MTVELHIDEGDEVVFEQHNANVFVLELGNGNRIWVSWKALHSLRRALELATLAGRKP